MSLAPLPPQPAGTCWPTGEWPAGEIGSAPVRAAVEEGYAFAFGRDAEPVIGQTHALLIVQGGRLVAERYADGFDAATTCHSWSMAKSITQALTGILVADGKLDIHAPADVPEWRGAGDPRSTITLDQLLRMSSGLAFLEEYVAGQPSDVIEMLFGAGKDDVAAFAAAFPLAHPPGAYFAYSSGTTNIVCRCLARALDATGEDFAAFMRARLFEPIGMKSPLPRFDAAGTFIGSSFCFATPRDFARFGLLYLRGGLWDGRPILPDGWVDYARTATYQQPGAEAADGRYGAHWWLDLAGPGSFSANGYDGQYIIIRPDRDLILVRHGATPLAAKDALKTWLKNLAAVF